MASIQRLLLLLLGCALITGCASFGESLVAFNEKFDQFNAEYDRQIYLQRLERARRNQAVYGSPYGAPPQQVIVIIHH